MKKVNLQNVTLVAVLVACVMFIVNTLFPGALIVKPVTRGLGSIGSFSTETVEVAESIVIDSVCVEEVTYCEDFATVE